jgi:hypothetical protein
MVTHDVSDVEWVPICSRCGEGVRRTEDDSGFEHIDCAARGPLTGQACALPIGHRGDHRTADGLAGWRNHAR